jgi:hypothetical protein
MKVRVDNQLVYDKSRYYVIKQYEQCIELCNALSEKLYGTLIKVLDNDIEIEKTNMVHKILFQKDSTEVRK